MICQMICQSLSPTDQYHNAIVTMVLFIINYIRKLIFVRIENWPILVRTDQKLWIDSTWSELDSQIWWSVRWSVNCYHRQIIIIIETHETRNLRAVSITAFAKIDQARDLKLTVFLRTYQRRRSYDSYLLLHFFSSLSKESTAFRLF